MYKTIDLRIGSEFSRNETHVLWITTLLGAAIRIAYQYDRSFIGDEVGTIIWMEKNVSYLLSHFGTWLTMNYFIILEKLIGSFFGNGPFSLGFVPLAAGISTIPLTAILAKRYTSTRAAIISSAFVAFNPYLIGYSGIIRSYSLLMALSVITILAFSRYCADPSLKNGILVSTVCFFLTLCHPNGLYTIVYILTILAILIAMNFTKQFIMGTIRTIAIPLSISMLLIYCSYSGIFPELFQESAKWHDTPPTSIAYIPFLFEAYFSTSYLRWISVLFLVIGVVSATFGRKPLLLLLIYLLMPIVCMSAQGLSHYPWAYARFLIPCVPALLIFISEGLCIFLDTFFSSRYRLFAAMILVGTVIATWGPNMQKQFAGKIPIERSRWYKVANYIEPKYQEGDTIICEGFIMQLHLQTYLSKSEYRIITLQEYIKGPDSNSHEGRIYLITSNRFKTTQPTEDVGNSKIIVYPSVSKNHFLTLLKDDYIQTSKDLSDDSELKINLFGNLCSITRFLDLENTSYCRFFEHNKTNKEEFRMTSIWNTK